jgi:hypothetical protein
MPRHTTIYSVVSEYPPMDNLPTLIDGKYIIFQSRNFLTARKECIEWAAYDDIFVEVHKGHDGSNSGYIKFSCDGVREADRRYPKTSANV